MARKNRNPHPRKSRLEDRFDRDYVNLPEYPNYTTITIIPLKTIFINLDAKEGANDFHVARSERDAVARKVLRRIEGEVIA